LAGLQVKNFVMLKKSSLSEQICATASSHRNFTIASFEFSRGKVASRPFQSAAAHTWATANSVVTFRGDREQTGGVYRLCGRRAKPNKCSVQEMKRRRWFSIVNEINSASITAQLCEFSCCCGSSKARPALGVVLRNARFALFWTAFLDRGPSISLPKILTKILDAINAERTTHPTLSSPYLN